MRRAFTLIELLVVISIIALLIAILLPALGAARQSAERIECLSKARQVVISTTAYATDSSSRLIIPSTQTGAGFESTLGLDQEDWEAFQDYGFDLPMWQCPGRSYEPNFNPTNGKFNHTYQYYGGVDVWQGSSWGVVEAVGPVTLEDMTREVAVVSDATVQSAPPSWVPDPGSVASNPYWADVVPHGRNEDFSPIGSNHAFGDGSGEWISADRLMPIHTWNTANRQLWWYQDDIGELETAGHIVHPDRP